MTERVGAPDEDLAALAKGGRTNIIGFVLRLVARLPFLFIAGRWYGPDVVGRFALAVIVVEFAALLATLGLKRGLAAALAETERPHAHVVWDAMALAFVVSLFASALLFALPQAMFPNSAMYGLERLLPGIVFAIALSDVALAALAYRLNVKASVTARAVIEPWTISIAAFVLAFVSQRDGLILAYVVSMLAAMIASVAPFVRSYGFPRGWKPRIGRIFLLARQNMPLAGADAVEWGSRNIDRFILGLAFPPAVVGIYYMAQQVSSLPQKLKTSFDPVLGPVITSSLANDDRIAVARQVKQVGFWIMAAQAALALALGIPASGVMGLTGPQFVAGSGALCFLLVAEVLAATGSVAESGLVYIARMRNLAISLFTITVQIALSFALIYLMRGWGWPPMWQAAGPAVALAASLGMQSIVKANFLSHLLGAPVSGWRWAFVWACVAAGAVGWAMVQLPEWAELAFGIPLILATYFWVLWRWAMGPDDRVLLGKLA